MIRKLLKLLVAVVLLVVIVAGIAWLYIDSIAKTGIEEGATYALGVPTTVENVSISLVGGTVKIFGLTVANPEGFKTPHLIKAGRLELDVQPGSLMSDTVEVNAFELDGLDMHIENKVGSSNVSTVLDHVKSRTGGGTAEPPSDETPAPREPGGKKIKADRIVVRNVTAHFQVLPIGGDATTLDIDVPEIILEDVTGDTAEGVPVEELTRRIIPAILAAVVKKSRGQVPKATLERLATNVTNVARAVGEGAGKLVEQAGKGAGKLFEGLFKKKPAGDPAEGAAEGDAPKKPGLLDIFKKKPEPDK